MNGNLLDSFLAGLNRMPLARGSVKLHNARLYGFTFDRLLYLWLHRTGFMGRPGLQEVSRHVFPGMTVVDVGANVGVYTSLFSQLVGPSGRVIALEPAPDNWRALSKAHASNHWSNVDIHQVAAADRAGRMSFARSSYNSGNNSLSLGNAENGMQSVDVVQLDQLLAGCKVDFIKIDVQGWEAAVLRGASQTLRQNRPLCARIEIWPAGLCRAGSGIDDVVKILESHDLRVDAQDMKKMKAARTNRGYFDIIARA